MGTLRKIDAKLHLQRDKQKLPLWLLLPALSSGELSGRLVWAAMASFKSGDDHVEPGQPLTASQGFCITSANSAWGQKPDPLVSMWRAVLRGACGSMAGSLERTL